MRMCVCVCAHLCACGTRGLSFVPQCDTTSAEAIIIRALIRVLMGISYFLFFSALRKMSVQKGGMEEEFLTPQKKILCLPCVLVRVTHLACARPLNYHLAPKDQFDLMY